MNSASKKMPQDLTVLDFGATATKVLRVKNAKGVLSLVGADLIPVKPGEAGAKLAVPKALRSRFCALAFDGDEAIIRLIHFRESIDRSRQWEVRIRENLGVDAAYRLGYDIGSSSKGKARDRCLAVALPDESLKRVLARVEGFRQTCSLEVSALASLNSFMQGPGQLLGDEAVAVICSGAKVTLLCIIYRQQPILVRKFQLGGEIFAERVAEKLSLELSVASQMVWQDSFDISSAVEELVNPFLHQLTISREFAERHENCKLSRVYLSGGLGQSVFWRRAIEAHMGMEVSGWNPFDAFDVPEGVLPPEFTEQSSRFAAAAGVALGVFKEL